MKLSTNVEKALNDQITLELASAYAYLGMAAWFESTPFTGFASWMKKQSTEELDHASRIFEYVSERGGRISLGGLPAPKCDYQSALEAFKASQAHEQKVSASILAIYELAGAEKDYSTQSFLKWFLDEQVEEEKSVGDMVATLELIGDNRNGLFHIDHRAAKRAEEDKK